MIGTGVTWSPNKIFTATFTPASWRGTIVADSRLSDEGAFGVDRENICYLSLVQLEGRSEL